MKLADISKYQNDIDFERVKKLSDLDAVIIRAGWRAYGNGVIYKDTKLDRNCSEAKENDIPFRLYFYSQAINQTERMLERQWLIEQANKHDNVLFLALDMELTGSGRGRADYLKPETRQLIRNTFRKCCKDRGYQPFIYSNENYWTRNLDYNSSLYMNWVRNWSKEPAIPHEIWQFSNHGKIPGIEREVDLNKTDLTIEDLTGKDTTYRTFKLIKEQLTKLSDLVTYLQEQIM